MTKLTWPTVAFLAVIGAIIVALASLTKWGSAEIIAVCSILLGVGGGAAVVGGMSGRVEQLHAQTDAQNGQLESIQRSVNGELTARIEAGATKAAETALQGLLAELRDQGVIR